jgi:hypothetical protein
MIVEVSRYVKANDDRHAEVHPKVDSHGHASLDFVWQEYPLR